MSSCSITSGLRLPPPGSGLQLTRKTSACEMQKCHSGRAHCQEDPSSEGMQPCLGQCRQCRLVSALTYPGAWCLCVKVQPAQLSRETPSQVAMTPSPPPTREGPPSPDTAPREGTHRCPGRCPALAWLLQGQGGWGAALVQESAHRLERSRGKGGDFSDTHASHWTSSQLDTHSVPQVSPGVFSGVFCPGGSSMTGNTAGPETLSASESLLEVLTGRGGV